MIDYRFWKTESKTIFLKKKHRKNKNNTLISWTESKAIGLSTVQPPINAIESFAILIDWWRHRPTTSSPVDKTNLNFFHCKTLKTNNFTRTNNRTPLIGECIECMNIIHWCAWTSSSTNNHNISVNINLSHSRRKKVKKKLTLRYQFQQYCLYDAFEVLVHFLSLYFNTEIFPKKKNWIL